MSMDETNKKNKKTRIAAHFADASPALGEVVIVNGKLSYYDENKKSWIPMRGKLEFYLDGELIGTTASGNYGDFTFTFPAKKLGKRKLEIRFKGKYGFDPCYKVLEFKVVRPEEKRRVEKLVRNVFVALLAFVVVILLLVFFKLF